jgi:ABC-type uncharacterized transport system permease subunit
MDSFFLACHIIGATLGQFLALVACVVGILYLWQRAILKKKNFSQLSSRIPALDRLETLLVSCLWVGFVFLTLAMLSGFFYFFRQGEYSTLAIEKVVWASCVWLWYLATLVMKKIFVQPSKRIAQMSLIGFMLLGAAVFGVLFIIIR